MKPPFESGYEKSVKAIQSGDFIALSQLLSDDPLLTKGIDGQGANLLHYAAALGNVQAFTLLNNAGTDAWHKDLYGDRPVDFVNTPSDDTHVNEGKDAIKLYLAEWKKNPAPTPSSFDFKLLGETHDAMEDLISMPVTLGGKLGAQISALRAKFFPQSNKDNSNKPE
jgi:hypothetical protein